MASDILPDCLGDNNPVFNLFFCPQNIAHILRRIANKTNSPPGGLGSDGLQTIMRDVSDRYPGPYQVQDFASKDQYADQVIKHVKLMNNVVVEHASQEVLATQGFADYYQKVLTGNRPLVDLPQHDKEIQQSRKSDLILLRDYTQWETFGLN